MLVGMCKNPALFNPLRRPDTTLTRRMVVLDQMRRNGFITAQAYDSLKRCPRPALPACGPHRRARTVLARNPAQRTAGPARGKGQQDGKYLYAKADGSPYDIYTDGLKVYTTMDRRMQHDAEFAVREHLAPNSKTNSSRILKRRRTEPFDFRVKGGSGRHHEFSA
jgi:penicillin-binding protein 1A